MRLGMIGLGKMGGGMARRLVAGGHEVVGYDPSPPARQAAAGHGIVAADSLASLAGELEAPRAVWMMVPSGGAVDAVLDELLPLLEPGDTVIDGGNSFYKKTLERGERLKREGLHLVDAGTSGGVWGVQEGYSLMVGGPGEAVGRLEPLLATLAPAPDRGWGHVGPVGAGHFVKMIHNGIEYGMMEAFAEGFAILREKKDFDLDLAQVAEVWRYGSVVRSWLLDLTARALADDQDLGDVAPYVEDSGEGRWTVLEAIELNVSAPVIALSLLERFRSRDSYEYADRLLAALRHQFGGHGVRKSPPEGG